MSAPAPGMPVRAGGRKPGLREGIALGALAAVAIVAAAVLFRLTQPGDVGVPQTAAARRAGSGVRPCAGGEGRGGGSDGRDRGADAGGAG